MKYLALTPLLLALLLTGCGSSPQISSASVTSQASVSSPNTYTLHVAAQGAGLANYTIGMYSGLATAQILAGQQTSVAVSGHATFQVTSISQDVVIVATLYRNGEIFKTMEFSIAGTAYDFGELS